MHAYIRCLTEGASGVVCVCVCVPLSALTLSVQAALGLHSGGTKELTVLDNLHGVLKPVSGLSLNQQGSS